MGAKLHGPCLPNAVECAICAHPALTRVKHATLLSWLLGEHVLTFAGPADLDQSRMWFVFSGHVFSLPITSNLRHILFTQQRKRKRERERRKETSLFGNCSHAFPGMF